MPHYCFSLDDLSRFIGPKKLFKYWGNKRLIYTEGVQCLVEQAKCHWLLDEIAFFIFPRLLKEHPDYFYYIELVVNPDCSALITINDGNSKTHFTCGIKWTDFPIKGQPVKFFSVRGSRGITV